MRASGRDGEISAWEVFQYFYCPRKLYFIRKLSIYPPERKKMEASATEHWREPGRVERRKTVYGFPEEEVECILKNVTAEDEELGLFGRADTVLKLKTGELIPVDTKYSDLRFVTLPWRKQLVAYSLLLERKFGALIKRALVYLRPSRHVFHVNITDEDKAALPRDLEKMRQAIDSDALPPKVSRDKCGYCEVQKFCRQF